MSYVDIEALAGHGQTCRWMSARASGDRVLASSFNAHTLPNISSNPNTQKLTIMQHYLLKITNFVRLSRQRDKASYEHYSQYFPYGTLVTFISNNNNTRDIKRRQKQTAKK